MKVVEDDVGTAVKSNSEVMLLEFILVCMCRGKGDAVNSDPGVY